MVSLILFFFSVTHSHCFPDSQLFVGKARALQSNLITTHVSLERFDGPNVHVIRYLVLPATQGAFDRLHRDIDLTIRDIGSQLGCKPMYIPSTQTGSLEFLARERCSCPMRKVQTRRE